MKVEFHDKLGSPIKVPATRVVVYDDFDNPLAVVVNLEGGQHIAITATHPMFKKVLSSLGINKTFIIEKITKKSLKRI